MVRTKGAKDLKQRKKRKFYAGRRIKRRKKSGLFVPYVPKRKKDDPIKLYFLKEEIMDRDSFKRFSAKTKMYMRRVVYGRGAGRIRIDVDPYQISSKEEIENVFLGDLWDGVWLAMGFSHGKNKYGVKPVKMFKLRISEHDGNLKGKLLNNYRLFRYWFFRKT